MFQAEGTAWAKALRQEDACHLEGGRVCHQVRGETSRSHVPEDVSRFSSESSKNKL